MKFSVTFILLSLLIFGCEKNPASIHVSSGEISITTDRNSYTQSDSLLLSIANQSGHDLILGYRCSYKNLEMFFQKKEKGTWSENQWFGYMSLKCMTLLRTIKKDKTIKHSISAGEFRGIGTFRLLVPCRIPGEDTTRVAISNAFEIK